ncbi:MAG: AAA family ATPase [Candidatus Micrarchaeaceae archaeon]
MSDIFDDLIENKKEEKKEEKKVEKKEVKTEKPSDNAIQDLVAPTTEPQKIDIEEETTGGKEVYVIYGDKGEGKTTFALSFPGEILALSFDRKTAPIRHNIYGDRKDIHVYDPVKVWKQTDDRIIVKTAKDVYDLIERIFAKYGENGVDWVVIDGTEVLEQIAELTMRNNHGLTAYQGISNLNLWKERRRLINHIHNLALNTARKGVIYTLWTSLEQVITEGSVVEQRKVPKWVDIVMFESDYVINVYYKDGYYAKVMSSKNPNKVPVGEYNVTGKGITAIWES